ncbi:VOC family protein [Rubellimicrobium arenae]|uniref:VOC family protein n=1 Tax=Rubellimicrobium arenae TaxID=2817372 RepID=UPI001B314603|nr:VOC family protein [Rubellimicrobium arenae]
MIRGLDHVVLTVRDPERAAAFYARVLGLDHVRFGDGRHALRFGAQKINLHRLGQETRNHACIGSGDLCLVTDWPVDATLDHLARHGVDVVEGPATKDGALGPVTSVYFRDEDGNLIEIARYDEGLE